MYSGFTHRFSCGGSRKLAIFKIELFLIIVNNVRCSLKVWQGSWIHFKFSLPFTASYVIQFIIFFFLKELLSTSHTDAFGFCIKEYFECADAIVQRPFTILQSLKSMLKRLIDYGVMDHASKFWNESLKPSNSS